MKVKDNIIHCDDNLDDTLVTTVSEIWDVEKLVYFLHFFLVKNDMY